jgi:hypothetical protein
MDLMLLRAFQSQVVLQCLFAIRAANEINSCLPRTDFVGVFYGVQNVLNAAANIKKALWGSNPAMEAARLPLRDSLGVADSSPLRQVGMRNNYEHFDERLDKWWRDSKLHNKVDLVIGSRDAINGLDTDDGFRMFDPQTTDVMFWGQKFNINDIINEIVVLHSKAAQEASKPHWV